MLQRILITGAAGSGKSTLAAELAKMLGYRWRDTDDFYWLPTATDRTLRGVADHRGFFY